MECLDGVVRGGEWVAVNQERCGGGLYLFLRRRSGGGVGFGRLVHMNSGGFDCRSSVGGALHLAGAGLGGGARWGRGLVFRVRGDEV
jgi:hypothetical protein